MALSDFDYDLPAELIAKYPTPERRGSRLLDVAGGLIDRSFADLPLLLDAGDLLVLNDTRVVPARLRGRKTTGGRIEVLIERGIESPANGRRALVQLRASKSAKRGTRVEFGGAFSAVVLDRQGRFFELEFSAPVAEVLDEIGEIPLPPYLGRDAEAADSERYQTVYAKEQGAVAAPTAGLHFDTTMLEQLQAAGIGTAFVTLHVGAGTFMPPSDEQLAAGRLHSERVTVDSSCCERVADALSRGRRVVAVGTTVVRALETAAADGEIAPFSGHTDLLITPGYEFRVVDALLTNFHLPGSSLLMLVSAFSGRRTIRDAYRHAIEQRYRFYSYGDAMWLTREVGRA